MKPSFVALPAVMLKEFALPGAVAPVWVPSDAVSVYPLPDLVMAHPVKFATPAVAVTVRPPVLVHVRTPLLGLVPMARVTESVLPVPLVTMFPLLSLIATDTLKLLVELMFWPELG